MSNHLVRDTETDPYGWRAGAKRIIANVLLVLLAFEVVSLAVGVAQMVVTGWTPPLPLGQFVVVAAVFFLVRWIFVLPGVLPVLAGIEYVARHAPHPRVLTAVVAFAPMVLWELLIKGPGAFPSGQGAVLARLPARRQGPSTGERQAAPPPAETAVV